MNEIVNCKNCESPLEKGFSFCGSCGTTVEEHKPFIEAKGNYSMIRRMIAAVQLKSSVYEEVEADKSATLQAMMVVVLASLSSGIAFIAVPVQSDQGQSTLVLIALGLFTALLGWALLAFIAHFVGTKVFPSSNTTADWGELARTLGFAQSPGVLRVLVFVPIIGPIIYIAATMWMLVATVIAIRQALDYTSTGRAILVTIVSYIPTAIIVSLTYTWLATYF